jgi:hypothetical protein
LAELERPNRRHRAGVERGDCCKVCGATLNWPKAAGVIYSDGTAACLPCHGAACVGPPVELPMTTANCARCRKVRALGAAGLCAGCEKEPPF